MSDVFISNQDAKQDKLFYVVASIIIVNQTDSKVLILKRSDKEKVHPGKWSLPGGKLEHSDVKTLLEQSGSKPIDGIESIMGKLAEREAEEECGLKVDGETAKIVSDRVFVRPDGIPVFMAVLFTNYKGGTVKISEYDFSDFAWVSKSDLANYDCIDGIFEEVSTALALNS